MAIKPINPNRNPNLPDTTDHHSTRQDDLVTDSRTTFGRNLPSRRTFGKFIPSRRTFGKFIPSRRTFGISHP